jgi:Na+-driven multidrug efflux pump
LKKVLKILLTVLFVLGLILFLFNTYSFIWFLIESSRENVQINNQINIESAPIVLAAMLIISVVQIPINIITLIMNKVVKNIINKKYSLIVFIVSLSTIFISILYLVVGFLGV